MGALFDAMSVRVGNAIQDSIAGTSNPIAAAADNGQKRSSAQRSQDINSARYWLWSLFRVANKKLFYGKRALVVSGAGGIGYGAITTFNPTSVDDMTLEETGIYKGPVPIYHGEDLELYAELLKSTKRKEIVAGVVGDNAQATNTFRLKILLGNDLQPGKMVFVFRDVFQEDYGIEIQINDLPGRVII